MGTAIPKWPCKNVEYTAIEYKCLPTTCLDSRLSQDSYPHNMCRCCFEGGHSLSFSLQVSWIGDVRNSSPWRISTLLIYPEFLALGRLERELSTNKADLGYPLFFVEHFYIIHLQLPNNLGWGNRTSAIISALEVRRESTQRLSDFHKFTHHINHRDETWIQHLIFLTYLS